MFRWTYLFFYAHTSILLSTNSSCLLNIQKIAKRKVQYEFDCCLIFHFGMNKSLFVFMLLSMHLLNFMLWVCVLCFNNLRWLYDSILLFHDLSKRGFAKFWLDAWFPRNPKLKWILKRPSLDRGYFKVYFFKKGKFSNNLVPYISRNS